MAGAQQLDYPLLDDPQPNDVPPLQPSAPVYEPSAPVSEPPAAPACQCRVSCWSMCLYLVLQVLVVVLEVAALASEHWLKYCFWEFGLLYGESEDHHSDFTESGLAFHLQDEYCESHHGFLNEPINKYCPVFCVNIWILAVYGVITLVLGIVAVLLSFIPLVMHGLALRGPLGVDYVHWLTFVPLKFWTVAWVLFYAGTLNLHIHAHEDSDDYPETKIGSAFRLAVLGSLGQLFLFVFVFFCTRKAFPKVQSS